MSPSALSGRGIIRAYLDVKIGIVDPWMLVIVPIPLILAAFCACYQPARRASSVDPTVALRHLMNLCTGRQPQL